MNKEVEQRIVEMQFNNSDFEAKVQKSLETLHKLKDATKLEDAGKGLDNLAKSAKTVDLSSIAAPTLPSRPHPYRPCCRIPC